MFKLSRSKKYEEKISLIEKLNAELSMIILERDELKYIVCKNIETEYMLKVGNLEYKLLEKEYEYLKLKRKIELVQTCINRKEKIDLNVIDKKLDVEFKEYKEKINEKLNSVNNALERKGSKALNEEEVKELKKLYRLIVKSLHPDLNKDVTEEELRLLDNAIEAYKNSDIKTLKLISLMISKKEYNYNDSTLDELDNEIKYLKESIEDIKKDMEIIKNTFPYNVRDIIKSKEKLDELIEDINNSIVIYEDNISILKNRLKELGI